MFRKKTFKGMQSFKAFFFFNAYGNNSLRTSELHLYPFSKDKKKLINIPSFQDARIQCQKYKRMPAELTFSMNILFFYR